MIKNYIYLLLLIGSIANAQVKILFDATKVQMAGSADWVIDADVHNLYTNNTVTTTGTESNPQRVPTPVHNYRFNSRNLLEWRFISLGY